MLTAHLTLKPGADAPPVAAFRSHLATQLPAAFIPARFHVASTIPRLPNGKVDRQSLLAHPPAGAASAATATGVAAEAAPSGTVEAILQDIWRSLLRREVGLDDDFFLLGGHSLLATRLVARVRDRLGVELPLIRIFEAPTVRGLARYLTIDPENS